MELMKYLVNSKEMKRCDAFTISKIGIPSMVLMERAALGVVEELFDSDFDLKMVLVVCGRGNNGGDGFVVARLLYLKNINVRILFVGDEKKCTPETSQQIKIVQNYGIEICIDTDFNAYSTIVDALFGIGLSQSVEGEYAHIIDKINKSGAEVLSVDVPSGISADSGNVMGIAVRAKKTVTFAYNKIGLTLDQGPLYAGIVKVKDIGITDISFEGVYPITFYDANE